MVTISAPINENMVISIALSTAPKPFGIKPPWSHSREMPLTSAYRIKAGNGDRAQYDKRQNSDHFAQRQPELEFAVVLDAQQVTAGEGE